MYADVLICSHPRSGGRWLRFLLAHYIANRAGVHIPESTDDVFPLLPDHHDQSTRGYPAYVYRNRPEVPLIAVCHQPYSWELHQGFPIIFLARNAYDVAVSGYHHLSETKKEYSGSMREFIRDPIFGVSAWVKYMNAWAPRLLTHRDTCFLSYGRLVSETEGALQKIVRFVDEGADQRAIQEAVDTAASLRNQRKIRTGQEGNFWDHLQPEEIFDIQEILRDELTDLSEALLERVGVDVDPFPRSE